MTKTCKVLLANEYVTVIKFEDRLVQLSSVDRGLEYVDITYENGKYFIADSGKTQLPKLKGSNQKTRKSQKSKQTRNMMPTIICNVAEDTATVNIEEL